MRRYLNLSFLFVILTTAIALCAGGRPPSNDQAPKEASKRTYHDSPSVEPLPSVLDPSQFAENHAAYVAYSLASQIPETLYQVPCYCGCDKNHGHGSLLDCFTGNHGIHCRICQKEAVFCFLQQKRGKTSAAIREALERGETTNFNIDKYTRKFYPQLRKREK
jgi:hypothetical protein